MQNTQMDRNAENIGAVHTHTHTSTFREIKRVADEATLYCVANRMTVHYMRKNSANSISCFLHAKNF